MSSYISFRLSFNSSSKFKQKIEDVMELSLEKRLTVYLKPTFVYTAVLYIAHWKALELISGEYLAAANAAKQQVMDNIKKAPTIKEALEQAPQLANEILEKIRKDQEISDIRLQAIKSQQKLLG